MSDIYIQPTDEDDYPYPTLKTIEISRLFHHSNRPPFATPR